MSMVDGSGELSASFLIRHTVPYRAEYAVLGPSEVRGVGDDQGLEYPFQRKTWYAAGRHWVFYISNSNFYYRSGTSTDGVIAWNAPVILRAVMWAEWGYQISVWVDGDILHYMYNPNTFGGDIRYRMGTLEPDGSITWAAAEQLVFNVGGSQVAQWAVIITDANGYPWIAWDHLTASTQTPRVTKSTTKNGSWTTDSDYPAILKTSYNAYTVIPVPLANGDVFVFFANREDALFSAVLCDDDGPGSLIEKAVTVGMDHYYTGAALAVVNAALCAFADNNQEIHLCKFESGAWGSDILIQAGVQGNTCPVLFKRSDTLIFIAWIDTVSDEVRYKISIDEGATWLPSGSSSYSVLLQHAAGFDSPLRYSVAPVQGTRGGSIATSGITWTDAANKIQYAWLESQLPNLKALFDVGQGRMNLPSSFTIRRSEATDLPSSFAVQRSSSLNLPAFMRVIQWGDLPCKFRVIKIYDLRGTMGIAFYWWGTGDDPEVRVGFILETPTGFWYSDFYDGPARFRHVFLPWGSFIWVSAEQRYLEPHYHGFNEPNKSKIDGFYWTVHTAGQRRVDYIYAPLGGDFQGKFIIRRSTSVALSAGFDVRQPFKDLKASFEVMVSRVDLIDEVVCLGVEQDIDFAGLDLNTHKFYRLIADIKNADSTYQCYIMIFFNGDEVQGNYSSKYQLDSGSVQSQSEPRIFVLNKDQRGKFEILITRDPDGYLNWSGIGNIATVMVRNSGRYGVVQANLTDIKLYGVRTVPYTKGDGFTAGSIFQLYGFKA